MTSLKTTSDPNNWAQQARRLRQHSLFQAGSNQYQERRQPENRVDVFDGRAARPRGFASRHRQHDVRPRALSRIPSYALDLDNDQKIVWKYEPKQDPSVIPVMCCDTVNRGVAYADGKIFLNQADTTLVALDAKTGKEVWKVVNGDPKKGETGTNAPLVIKDKVIVGVSGAEFGVRGHITAYNIADGKLVWRAYSSGPDNEILVDPEKTMSLGKPVGKDTSLKTWNGDQWKIGGGSTWGWFSWDPKLNLLYYGTANPSTWNSVQRAGPDGKPIDQKWTMSIFARNPDTGVAAWAYQMTPFDQWDYDGVNEMILVDDLDVKGREAQCPRALRSQRSGLYVGSQDRHSAGRREI